jgi:hypothetical protein
MKKIFFALFAIAFVSSLCFAQKEQTDVFALNYQGKYVEILLKNGKSLDGNVFSQIEDRIGLKVNNTSIFFNKQDIEKITIKEEEKNIRQESLKTDYFEILDPAWGYYKGALSTFFQPTISFSVKNIGSAKIKELYFKAIFFKKEDKVMMGEEITEVKNIPSGYSSVKIAILCPSGWEIGGASLGDKLMVMEQIKKMEVRLFWSENNSGQWKEIPDFSKHCKVDYDYDK